MNRRKWLSTILAGTLFGGFAKAGIAAGRTMKHIEELQKNWKKHLPANAKVPAPAETLQLTDAEWRKRLSKDEYYILRQEGTERPDSSPLNNEKRDGVFVCAGCGLPVFTSAMKYESGTGWPSFFTTISGAFETKPDRKLFITRTEYHCKRCGGHHGHVFDDGPEPTKERWCNNGLALRFIPKKA